MLCTLCHWFVAQCAGLETVSTEPGRTAAGMKAADMRVTGGAVHVKTNLPLKALASLTKTMLILLRRCRSNKLGKTYRSEHDELHHRP